MNVQAARHGGASTPSKMFSRLKNKMKQDEEFELPRLDDNNPLHERPNPDIRLEMRTLGRQAPTSTALDIL